MMLLVYMRDGRTVYFITGRGVLRQLCGAEPWGEHKGVDAARGIWDPHTGAYVWTRGIRLRFLSKSSISVVEEGTPDEAVAP